MTTTTNNISIPALNLRAERVYQWVENQTHARTRTARGIQELRLSTTNAERRLSELQCLSARLAQDAKGSQWWENRWTLLNGQIAIASPRTARPFSTSFDDDLPKPRHYPNRPKTRATSHNNWIAGGSNRRGEGEGGGGSGGRDPALKFLLHFQARK